MHYSHYQSVSFCNTFWGLIMDIIREQGIEICVFNAMVPLLHQGGTLYRRRAFWNLDARPQDQLTSIWLCRHIDIRQYLSTSAPDATTITNFFGEKLVATNTYVFGKSRANIITCFKVKCTVWSVFGLIVNRFEETPRGFILCKHKHGWVQGIHQILLYDVTETWLGVRILECFDPCYKISSIHSCRSLILMKSFGFHRYMKVDVSINWTNIESSDNCKYMIQW